MVAFHQAPPPPSRKRKFTGINKALPFAKNIKSAFIFDPSLPVGFDLISQKDRATVTSGNLPGRVYSAADGAGIITGGAGHRTVLDTNLASGTNVSVLVIDRRVSGAFNWFWGNAPWNGLYKSSNTDYGVAKDASDFSGTVTTTLTPPRNVGLLTYNGSNLTIYTPVETVVDTTVASLTSGGTSIVLGSAFEDNPSVTEFYSLVFFDKALSQAEAKFIVQNPWQIFSRQDDFVYFTASSGGISSSLSEPLAALNLTFSATSPDACSLSGQLGAASLDSSLVTTGSGSLSSDLSSIQLLTAVATGESCSFEQGLESLSASLSLAVPKSASMAGELSQLLCLATSTVEGVAGLAQSLEGLGGLSQSTTPLEASAISSVLDALVGEISQVTPDAANLAGTLDSLGISSAASVIEVGQTIASILTTLDGLVAQSQSTAALQGQALNTTGNTGLASGLSLSSQASSLRALLSLDIQALSNSSIASGLDSQISPLSGQITGLVSFGDARIAFLAQALDSLSHSLQSVSSLNASSLPSLGLSLECLGIAGLSALAQVAPASINLSATISLVSDSSLDASLYALSLVSQGVSLTPTLAALDAILEGMLVSGSGVNGLHLSPSRWVVREHASDVVIYQQSGRSVIHENQ